MRRRRHPLPAIAAVAAVLLIALLVWLYSLGSEVPMVPVETPIALPAPAAAATERSGR